MHDQQISEDTQTAVALLRELITSYTEFHRDIEISVKDFDSECIFKFRGNTDDYHNLVGRAGRRVAALEHIVKLMGRSRGVIHRFRLLEPESGPRREAYEYPVADSYDPEPITNLVKTLIVACGVEDVQIVRAMTSAPNERPLSYSFSVFTRSAQDYDALTVPPPHTRQNLTLILAIEALLEQAGKLAGVRFSLVAVRA